MKMVMNNNDNLESRQTLFKWNIGMTRVAFRSHATATASHICIKSMKKQSNNGAIIFYNKQLTGMKKPQRGSKNIIHMSKSTLNYFLSF